MQFVVAAGACSVRVGKRIVCCFTDLRQVLAAQKDDHNVALQSCDILVPVVCTLQARRYTVLWLRDRLLYTSKPDSACNNAHAQVLVKRPNFHRHTELAWNTISTCLNRPVRARAPWRQLRACSCGLWLGGTSHHGQRLPAVVAPRNSVQLADT